MKRLFYGLSIFFVVILLMSCGSAVHELPKLSSSLKEEIETAYKTWRGMEILWYDESDESTWAEGVRYYGTFGEVEALYFGGSGDYMTSSGVVLDNGLGFYWEGKIYPISYSRPAREAGAMTTKDLQNLAKFHKTFSVENKKGEVFVYEGCMGVTILPSELQKEVEVAWWERKNCELSWTRKDDTIRYYGSFDGTVVIYTDTSALGNWFEIEIGGVKIGGGNFSLYAYREGEIVDANEAYANGWLTKENLQTIAEYHELYESK